MWVPGGAYEDLIKKGFSLEQSKGSYDQLPWAVVPLKVLAGVVSLMGVRDFTESLKEFLRQSSLFSVIPLEAHLRQSLNVEAIKNSQIILRIATVSQDSGKLHWIDNFGHLLDSDGRMSSPPTPPVSLVDAVLASAAIPVVFSPIQLNGELFVDGGVREFVPAKAAFDLHADKIYLIATNAGVEQFPPLHFVGDDPARLLSMGARAAEIMADEVQQRDLDAGRKSATPVTIIRPTMPLPSSLTVDPGWIRILMAYGYMRAFDALGNVVPNSSQELTDSIIAQRLTIWALELRLQRPTSGIFSGRTANEMIALRKAKLQLLAAVRRRLPAEVPLDMNDWWTKYEQHVFGWNPMCPEVWSACRYPDGSSVAAENPPSISSLAVVVNPPAAAIVAGVPTDITITASDPSTGNSVSGLFWINPPGLQGRLGERQANVTLHAGDHEFVVHPGPGFPDAHTTLKILRLQPALHPVLRVTNPPGFLQLGVNTTFTVDVTDAPCGSPIAVPGSVAFSNPGAQAGEPSAFYTGTCQPVVFTFRKKTAQSGGRFTDITFDVDYPTGKLSVQDHEGTDFDVLQHEPAISFDPQPPSLDISQTFTVIARDLAGNKLPTGDVTIINPGHRSEAGNNCLKEVNPGFHLGTSITCVLRPSVRVRVDPVTDEVTSFTIWPSIRVETASYKDATVRLGR